MERPRVVHSSVDRQVSGEIVYYDQMRQLGKQALEYGELSDRDRSMYDKLAVGYTQQNDRPAIMAEYERFEPVLSEEQLSCIALADELLKLKDEDSSLTFVDISVETSPEEVIALLEQTRALEVLSKQDTQLAIPSDGSHYPVMDIRKEESSLIGVGLRVWGWEYPKVMFTNRDDEEYDWQKHLLMYPENETTSSRQLEIGFQYKHNSGEHFIESVSLILGPGGSRVSSQIWMSAYAETGYEGHGGNWIYDVDDCDAAAYADVIAKIVGDMPESRKMKQYRMLKAIVDNTAIDTVRQKVITLINATHPIRALYLLTCRADDEEAGSSIEELLKDPTRSDDAISALDLIIAKWGQRY